MFYGAGEFEQNLNGWNTSKVTNMRETIMGAKNFTGAGISNWKTVNVKDMSGMFWFAPKFNEPIGEWDVSKVTNMERMFQDAKVFNQDISQWNVQKVKDMGYMFSGAKAFNSPIENWQPYALHRTSWMFNGASTFNQNMSTWGKKALYHKRYTQMYNNCNIDEANKFRSMQMILDEYRPRILR